MTEFFYDLLKASFHGSVVILAVVLLRQLLKTAPRSVFCLLWLLAGLRLVLPFEIESNLSLQPQVDAPELSIQVQQPVQVPDILIQNPEGQPLDEPQSPNLPEGNWENVQTESFLYQVEDGVIRPITFGDIAARVWILGVAVMVAASAVSYIRLKRRVRMAYLIENGCFECPGLETAFVLGFLPPKIYLPAGLTDDEKKFIFDHENTHIARHDHWHKLLGYLVLSLHWFNPLVWIGYGLLCRDIELACDEHVVKHMSLAQRKAYSAALLSCGGHAAGLVACPVAFGESNPKKRILNVLNYKRPTFWISLLAVIAVIFVAVCLLTNPAEEAEQADEAHDWNLEMTVTDVTPSGAQVQFVQSGIFLGSDRALLQYGSYYTLERWEGEEWVTVEMLPQEYEVAWTMEAYLINLNSTNAFNVNWAWLYGELPEGKYRIGKNVDLFRGTGDYDTEMFWAEFTIEQMLLAWNMDMTDEELLELCRNAVAEFQSRESYHISETLLYYVNDREDARRYVAYWSDGVNNARQSYSPRTEETRTHLYYEGQLYYRMQADGEESTWSLVESDHGERYNLTWLHLLDWDAQEITFEFAEDVEGVLHVFLTAHSTPVVFGWDDVTEYTLGFFFDQSGRMTNAMMGSAHEEIQAMSDLKMETTSADSVKTKLEQMAQQRPSDLAGNPNEDYLETCRTALESYQAQGSWVLLVENTFTGDGAMNPYSTALWYIHGQEWYKQAITGSADFTAEHCYLKTADKTYCRENCTVHDPANGEGFSTGWVEDSQYADMPLPWPLTFNWDEENLEYVQTEQWDRGEKVTFAVRGSLYAGQQRGIDSYQVSFWLTEKGELWSIDISYSEKDVMGETTNVRSVITPNAAAPEEATKMIQQYHKEALLHVCGICSDPTCTDSSHDHSGVNCTDDQCTNSTHSHHDDHGHNHH